MTSRHATLTAITVIAGLAIAPTIAAADEFNGTLFSSGASTFVVAYGAAAIAAASTSTDANQKLYIPLAGPWLDLDDRTSCGLLSTCHDENAAKALLIVDGIFQAGGVLTMLDGLLFQRRETVVVTDRRVHFSPTTYAAIDGAAPGLAVFGRF